MVTWASTFRKENCTRRRTNIKNWLVLGWEESYGNWEVLSVLFAAAAIETKVKEIFTEYMRYTQVKVDCWHKDNMDDPDAS